MHAATPPGCHSAHCRRTRSVSWSAGCGASRGMAQMYGAHAGSAAAMSSAVAGLVAATMGAPADVIKTRIMNQPTDAQGRGTLYKGTLDCLRTTIENEGAAALYKGWLPTWMRMAPWSLAFFLSFEQLRKVTGQESF